MGFLRDLKNGLGPFTLEYGTPIVHVGDFNLVGYRQQLETLTHGDIVDEVSYGNDFSPDWDDSPLTDLFSRHTHIRMGYTWRHDGSEYNPGKLDYILYTDWVVEPENHFVLNTMAMTEEDLSFYDLEMEDTNIASDHLPRIMDISQTLSVTSFSVQNSAGWNMVGLPLNVIDNHYLALFQTSTEGTLYKFNLTYLPSSTMFTGEGYWLHFQNEGETTLFGYEVDELSIQIFDGWNLISGITSPVQISDIDDPDGLILTETCFHYQDGLYNNVGTILPGKSYWIYSTGVGVVGLSN